MLSLLSIRDIVLIDRADIAFEQGLCVLTGETGAGKSILLDALGLATGARADKRLVRHGADEGAVTVLFHVAPEHPAFGLLKEHGIAPGDGEEILLRRVVSVSGPSRAFINDQPVGAGLLAQVGGALLEIHGQHDDRGLLDPVSHRAVLDVFAGLEADVKAVGAVFRKWSEALEAYQIREATIAQARTQADYLEHMVKELEALDPQADEEETLAAERTLLMNAEKIGEDLDEAVRAISGTGNTEKGAQAALNIALRRLARVKDKAAGKLDGVLDALERALTEVSEASFALDALQSEFQVDADRLSRTEERLFALRAAARKHGVRVDELADIRARFEEQWSALETGEADLAKLRALAEEHRAGFLKAAKSLSKARSASAQKLDKAVMAELAPLKLEKAQLQTAVREIDESKAGAGGLDQVRFEVSTNPGAPFGPLTQIASGGELSRFILALKVVMAAGGPDKVLIFDEIDRGVGGAVADAVGSRLSRLAEGKNAQVLVVTHSPQVAAAGNHHWQIAKGHDGDQMVTRIEKLSTEERQEEVARMLAGAEVTDEARAAAAKLLKTDAKPKSKKRAKRG